MAIPNVEVVDVSKTKISDENSMDLCEVQFQCTNERIVEYEIRAVKDGGTTGRGQGLLVGIQYTLYPSDTTFADNSTYANEYTPLEIGNIETDYIEDEELTNGDGNYIITIYCKNESGEWNG